MVNIKVQAAALELLPLLSHKTYAIHSCFENGCNIIIEDRLCFVGNKNNGLLPYGLLINRQDTALLKKHLQSSNLGLKWNEACHSLEGDGLRLLFKNTRLYDSRFGTKNNTLPHNSLSLLKASVNLTLKTGFGPTIGELTAPENSEVNALIESLGTSDTRQASNTLRRWMGRGLGLTPSGDDFLLGILFVNHIQPILSQPFYNQLKAFAKEQIYTTDVSNHFYRCAFKHLFSQIFINLYKALEVSDPQHLKRGIQALLSVGHTSGRDMLSGIVVGLGMVEKTSTFITKTYS